MVAITVILAAVIAAFVFGMTGNIQGTKVVSIGSKLDGDKIVLTINGGPDLPALQGLTITVGGKSVEDGAYNTVSSTTIESITNFKVGDTITISGDDLPGRLLVVGKWSDGAEQIIIDHTY
jgi:FlaG/FlaF family flagellin (archaellin)